MMRAAGQPNIAWVRWFMSRTRQSAPISTNASSMPSSVSRSRRVSSLSAITGGITPTFTPRFTPEFTPEFTPARAPGALRCATGRRQP